MPSESDEQQNDDELSYNVEDIELDSLYQDEEGEDSGKSSQLSQSRKKEKNEKELSPNNLPRKPDRPLFRPRQLSVRGRGRGYFRGPPRGRGNSHRFDSRRKPDDSNRRARSRSEEDLRVMLDSAKNQKFRSSKRSRSKENKAMSGNRVKKSSQHHEEKQSRSSSREEEDRKKPKGSQGEEPEAKRSHSNETNIRHGVLNNKKFESKSGPSGSKDKRSRSRSNDSDASNKESQLRNNKNVDKASKNKFVESKDIKKKPKSNYDSSNSYTRTKESDSRNEKKRSVSPANSFRSRGSRAKSKENDLRDKGKSLERDTKAKDRQSQSSEVDLSSKSKRPESKNNVSKANKRSMSRSSDSRSKCERSKSKLSASRDKNSECKNRHSRSRGRRSASRGRRSTSRRRRSNSRGRRSVSRGRRSSSNRRLSSSRRRCSVSRGKRSASRGRRSASKGRHSVSRAKRSASRGRRSASRGKRSTSRAKRSASKGRRSASRGKRSTSRAKRSASRGRRSASRRRCSDSRGRFSASRAKRSTSRGRISASRAKRSTSRGRRSASRAKRSTSRGRRSASRVKRSTSRGRRSASRGRQSSNKGRSSVNRGIRSASRRRVSTSRRRSVSKGRRSVDRRRRSSSRRRRSRSRYRRSRSRPRRSRSRSRRSTSRKRFRKAGSRSSSSSRSSSRRRYRTYSRSRSKSSDVIIHKPRIELIDIDKYEENRARGILSHLYSDPLFSTSNIGQIGGKPQFSEIPPVAGNSFGPQPFVENPPPLFPFASGPVLEPEFGYEQPPSAPFIPSHLHHGPPPFVPHPPPPPPMFITQPSVVHHTQAVIIQRPISPAQFHSVSQPQSQEFGNFQHNVLEDFPGRINDGFQPPHVPPVPSFNQVPSQHPPEDTWNAPIQKQPSSFSLYDLELGPPTSKKSVGMEEEKQNQKQTLVIQRSQYILKNAQLQKELASLKDQRTKILDENLSESEGLLLENKKLQNVVTQRLKAVVNVIEMLSDVIEKDQPQNKKKYSFSSSKDSRRISPLGSRRSPQAFKSRGEDGKNRGYKKSSEDRDGSSPRRDRSPVKRNKRSPHSREKMEKKEEGDDAVIILEPSPPPLNIPTTVRSPLKLNLAEVPETKKPAPNPPIEKNSASLGTIQAQVNLVHYDPELHWCSLCNVFPKTVMDYLNHLHTPEHKQQIATLKIDASPWHLDERGEPQPPIIKNALMKRIPIRGVQFLVPATGWYCRLCKTWAGDMHCAQDHLKGRKHTSNYSEYIAQNPHWEVDWLSDRTKSFERTSENLSRLRDKEESPPLDPNCGLESEKAKFSALSDTLLAVLAQQNKVSRKSSSSSESEDDRRKHKRIKKKKFKKRKKTPEKTSLNKVH